MSEDFLHFVWAHRLFYPEQLFAATNEHIEVISPGCHNLDSGPDFFNAKIRINGTIWAGNIEIHKRSSDWYRHGHHIDAAYNNVILHIAEENDDDVFTADNRRIPSLKLPYDNGLLKQYHNLEFPTDTIPCAGKLKEIEPHVWNGWLDRLRTERLERKSEEILKDLSENKNHREQTFYIFLTRHFGFGKNTDPFELVARSIPFSVIKKHQTNRFKIEAILLGQAGLLNKNIDDKHFQNLKKEYEFISHKCSLIPIESSTLKLSKIRPQNFPAIRLSLLAGLLCKPGFSFYNLLKTNDFITLSSLFQTDVSEYWKTHYSFKKTHMERDKSLGKTAIYSLLINVLVPMVFVYGKQNDSEKHLDFACEIMDKLPPENNSLLEQWKSLGIIIENAGTAQALMQLTKEYCHAKKCLFCPIGYQLLKYSSKKINKIPL